jgi:hypothetical protein
MSSRIAKSLVPLVGAAALVVAPVVLAAPASADVDPAANKASFWEDYLYEEEGMAALCTKVEPVATPYSVPDIEDLFDADSIEESFPGVDADDLEYILGVVKAGSGDDANELVWEPVAGDELAHSEHENLHLILCIARFAEEPSPSPSTTSSATPSATASATPTATPSATPSATLSATASATPSATTTTAAPSVTTSTSTHPTTTKPATGPVIETDRTASESAGGLGLAAAAAALLAGAGAFLVGRRRQGSHR